MLIPGTDLIRNYDDTLNSLTVGANGEFLECESLGLLDKVLYLFGYGSAGIGTVISKIQELSIKARSDIFSENNKALNALQTSTSQVSEIKPILYKLYTISLEEEILISMVKEITDRSVTGDISLLVYKITCFIQSLFPWITKKKSSSLLMDDRQVKEHLNEIVTTEIKDCLGINAERPEVLVWHTLFRKNTEKLNSFSCRLKINNLIKMQIELNFFVEIPTEKDSSNSLKKRICTIQFQENSKNKSLTLVHSNLTEDKEKRSAVLSLVHRYLNDLKLFSKVELIIDLPEEDPPTVTTSFQFYSDYFNTLKSADELLQKDVINSAILSPPLKFAAFAHASRTMTKTPVGLL